MMQIPWARDEWRLVILSGTPPPPRLSLFADAFVQVIMKSVTEARKRALLRELCQKNELSRQA